MRAKPDRGDLLAIARKTLVENLIPKLAGEDRFTALMIANALGVVERELSGDEATESMAGRLLGRVYGDDRDHGIADLARDIRAGRLDGRADVGEDLIELSRQRCLLSNPKEAAALLGDDSLKA